MALFPLGILSAAGAGGGVFSSDYELISTTLISSNTPSVTFDVSSLGSTYKHLQIRGSIRTLRGSTGDIFGFRFNSDAATNYNTHRITGTGASVEFGGDNPNDALIITYNLSSSDAANQYTAFVMDLLDPFSTTKNKTTRLLFGNGSAPNTGAGNRHLGLESGMWRNTNAITSILAKPLIGSDLVSGSRLSIYGIKG
jgi:hypothetical protein